MSYKNLCDMEQVMPQVRRHSSRSLDALLSRTLVPIALAVVMLGGVSLRSAKETPVVWAASSIGPAYSQFQSLSCSAVPTSCPLVLDHRRRRAHGSR